MGWRTVVLLLFSFSTMAASRVVMIVEADGLFDGHRRVRMPWPPQPPADDGSTPGLWELRSALLGALGAEGAAAALAISNGKHDDDMSILVEFWDRSRAAFVALHAEAPSMRWVRNAARVRLVLAPALLAALAAHGGGDAGAAAPMLALPYKSFSFRFEAGEMLVGGAPLYIGVEEDGERATGEATAAVDKGGAQCGGAAGTGVNADAGTEDGGPALTHTAKTGLSIWDGSVVLAKYLEHKDGATTAVAAEASLSQPLPPPPPPSITAVARGDTNDCVRGLHVLEVGAGTGLVGIAAGLLSAREVTITDLPFLLPRMRANVARNAAALKHAGCAGGVRALALDWTAAVPADVAALLPGVRLVLASDVVWVDELLEPLASTLRVLMRAAAPGAAVLLSYQERSRATTARLFGLLRESFVVEEVPREEHHPHFRTHAIQIFRLTRLSSEQGLKDEEGAGATAAEKDAKLMR